MSSGRVPEWLVPPPATPRPAPGPAGGFWLSFGVATAGSVLSVLFELFAWPLDVTIGNLPILVFFMGLLLVFALSASWSIVHLWTYIRGHPLLAMLPFLFALLATGSFLTGALTDGVYMTNDFVAHGSREAVVAMIEAGELSPSPNRSYKWTPGLSDPYQLPPEYERLSKRGIVAVYEQEGARHVIFFAGWGMFESFSGYVYRADDGEPLLPERALHGPRFHRVKRLRDHWFLVGYYD